MKIDKDNPPTEVWHINRERIRKGLGVQKLAPAKADWFHTSIGSSFTIKGRRGRYHSMECYPSYGDAYIEATRILRIDLRDEMSRHNGCMERLNAAKASLMKDGQL